MNTLLLPLLEGALQTALRFDPETRAALGALENTCLKLEITDWRQTLFFLIKSKTVYCYGKPQDNVAVSIRGKLSDLIALSTTKKTRGANSVHIEGNMDTAQSIQALLKNVDIEWEELVAHATSDGVAHHLGRAFSCSKRALMRTRRATRESIEAYLKDEANIAVDAEEADNFYDAVDVLRSDADRLEARIRHLESREA